MTDTLPETLAPGEIAIYTDCESEAVPFQKEIEEKYKREAHLYSTSEDFLQGTSARFVILYRLKATQRFRNRVLFPLLTIQDRKAYRVECPDEPDGEVVSE